MRAEEERQSSTSVLAFMMQEHDIYHLVNHIWHGQSAISKVKDLFILRLVRYQKDVEWAPWNCILLTEDEAEVHYRIHDLTTVYSKHLINQINLKHQIAKNYFKYVRIQYFYPFLHFLEHNIKISEVFKLCINNI